MGVIPLREFELKHANAKHQNLNFFLTWTVDEKTKFTKQNK